MYKGQTKRVKYCCNKKKGNNDGARVLGIATHYCVLPPIDDGSCESEIGRAQELQFFPLPFNSVRCEDGICANDGQMKNGSIIGI